MAYIGLFIAAFVVGDLIFGKIGAHKNIIMAEKNPYCINHYTTFAADQGVVCFANHN